MAIHTESIYSSPLQDAEQGGVMQNSQNIIQDDLDRLADVLWWIKGYVAACNDTYQDAPFWTFHIEALQKIKESLQSELNAKTASL